jgi:ABC-type ATPase involved in cell division
MSTVNSIEVENLRRVFAHRAVDGISFEIRGGEIFGLLGPNGAGKTTTIKMLCTLMEPTSGTARVAGYDIVREPTKVRGSMGTVFSGERSLYWKLTARENLEYFAALYNVEPSKTASRIDLLLDRMDLKAKANELVERYSTGMRQRLAIARAPNGVLDRLRSLPLVRGVESRASDDGLETWIIRVLTEDNRQTFDVLLDLLCASGDRVLNMKANEPTLEDVFIALTGKSLRD